MDLFTRKANNIVKSLNEDANEDSNETVIYSSEENAEDPQMKAMGLDKNAIAAINVASNMSTQAAKSGVYGFRTDPQKAMNQAYGKLMNSIAKKITPISANIK